MATNPHSPVRETFDRVVAFLRGGDAEMAEELARQGLREFPGDGNLHCLLGAALLRQRRFKEAEKELEETVRRHPEYGKAHEELANTLLAQGRVEDALVYYRRAAELQPERAAIHYKLARALGAVGQSEEAQHAMQTAFKLNPNHEALAKAHDLQRHGKVREAEKAYRDVILRDPKNVDALRFLASLAVQSRNYGEAVLLLRRTVRFAPDFAEAWTELADALVNLDEYEEAVSCAERVIELQPLHASSYMLMGKIHARAGENDKAIEDYHTALEKRPDVPAALVGLGNVLKTVGRQDEAIDAYRKCISVLPGAGESYWSLSNLKIYRFDDEEINAMEQQLELNLPGDAAVYFHFALGKAYEDRDEYDTAFEHYRAGNEARRKRETYDPVETEVVHDNVIETFSAEFLSEKDGCGNRDNAPIFIMGLPRSGSTLIEQILASHSMVEGTRELPDLNRVVKSVNQSRDDGVRYPKALQTVPHEKFVEFGQQYLNSTQRYRTGTPHFIDKMPNNFAFVGLVHLILPAATIIDARRNPLDACFGNYKQLFFEGQPFTYDLVEIGEFYLEYLRVMDHFNTVLPGKVLTVQYEDVVADLDSEVKRLLDHCNLPFEEQCLRFYETERAVNTASSEQVRQPIYTGSVGVWRHFEQHLDPLIEVLEPELMKLPAAERPQSLQ